MKLRTVFEGTFFNEYIDDQGYLFSVPVSFTMNVQFDGTRFKGTRIDDETKDFISDPIYISGFIQENLISFTVKYPYNYYIDSNTGQTILLKDEPHPGVTYIGDFDDALGHYTGEYRVLVDEEQTGLFQDSYVEGEIIGTWEMIEIKPQF